MALTTEQKAALFDLGLSGEQGEKIAAIFGGNNQDPPKQDPPKQDPPKQDPPKQDPPKQDNFDVFAFLKAFSAAQNQPSKDDDRITKKDMEDMLQKFAMNTTGGNPPAQKTNEELLAGALSEYWGEPKKGEK